MTEQQKEIGLVRVVFSVLAAMFGVQSDSNRERDFSQGRPAAYIIVGIILTVLFILTVWMVVKVVMSLSGV